MQQGWSQEVLMWRTLGIRVMRFNRKHTSDNCVCPLCRGVDTRLLGSQATSQERKTRWRDWSTVFKVYAGAAIPRLQKLMDDAAKVAAPIPNATIMDANDRAASTQLCWIDAHDLQGRTAQHRVPGSRQRRSRSLATTDREVRAEHGLQGN